MGYVNKTISKNEALIKQAKICLLSFFDRFFIAGVYAVMGLAGILGFVMDPIAIENYSLEISSITMAAAGAILLLALLVLGIYRLIQAIGKVEAEAVIPSSVFGRIGGCSLVGLLAGVGTFLMGGGLIVNIINVAVGLLFGGIVVLFALLKYYSIKFVVSDKRVFGRRNIWMTKSFDLPISKIDNVLVDFSFWGKMFNYGTVTIRSVMGEYKIKYVKSPEEFKNLIVDFAMNNN